MKTKKTNKANLENKKVLFREIGLAIALLLVLGAFEWGTEERKLTVWDSGCGGIIIEDDKTPITRQEEPQPPKPQVKDDFVVVENDVPVKEIFLTTFEDRKKWKVDSIVYVDRPPVEEPEDFDKEFSDKFVEEKPTFMGGDENQFTKWVYQRLEYPESAKENGVGGRVAVSFVIDKDGKLADAKIMRSVDPAIDREVLRVVNMSPKWKSGKQRGKPVRVRYIIPITFQLR